MPFAGVRLQEDGRIAVVVAEGHPVRGAPIKTRQTGCWRGQRAAIAVLENVDGKVVLFFALNRRRPFDDSNLAARTPARAADAWVRGDDGIGPLRRIPKVNP